VIAIPPERVLELTPGELGLIVLDDLIITGEWNEWNYLKEANKSDYRGEAAAAIFGAIGWLRGQGLVGRDPENSQDSAIVVTRAGHLAVGASRSAN
jgi:hypothetical protein